jgi:hypothetical protein
MITETTEAPEYFEELGERARANALQIAKLLFEAGVEAGKAMRIAICTAKRLSDADRPSVISPSHFPRDRSQSSKSSPFGLTRQSAYESQTQEETYSQ